MSEADTRRLAQLCSLYSEGGDKADEALADIFHEFPNYFRTFPELGEGMRHPNRTQQERIKSQ